MRLRIMKLPDGSKVQVEVEGKGKRLLSFLEEEAYAVYKLNDIFCKQLINFLQSELKEKDKNVHKITAKQPRLEEHSDEEPKSA